jgi:DnaJ-class molecular chaperone
MKNYYEILGLTSDCDIVELKTVYRRLARKYHPDVNGDAQKFKEVTEAYTLALRERERARRIDLRNEQSEFSARGKGASKPLNAELTISATEAARGVTRTINIMHTSQCPNCRGRKHLGANCPECEGKGEVLQHKKVTVRIPPGVKNNARLRVATDDGEIFLTVKIETRMKYDGANILYTLALTPFEAALGTEAEIPTFNGNIMLKIPPNTNAGHVFHLAGENGKGDMIVMVSIEIPPYLSQDEIKLYEKLRKAAGKKHDRKS